MRRRAIFIGQVGDGILSVIYYQVSDLAYINEPVNRMTLLVAGHTFNVI